MKEEQIVERFKQGIDCSQIVFEHAANAIGFDRDKALKIAAGFGGGMWAGRTCGCVCGAIMALGLKYGHCKDGDMEQKNVLLAKKADFEQQFKACHGSLVCKEILGYDLSKPEDMQQIMEKNLLLTVCPKCVKTACEILDKSL